MEGRINIYRGLVREPVRKRPLWTTRRKWENIKMDRQYVDVAAWTGSSWLRIETSGGHFE